MASPLPGGKGAIAVKTNSQGSTIDIQVTEPVGMVSENLSLSTWGAAVVLANELYDFAPPGGIDQDSWILEIGAGTGVVGITAAALWRAKVILTDLPSIVPGLAANVAVNRQLLRQYGGSAQCGFLDWTNPTKLVLADDGRDDGSRAIDPRSRKPEIILAADIIYSEDHPELVCDTISTWLDRTPKGRAILCYPLRMAYIEHIRELWELLGNSGLECSEEGRHEGNDEWNEIASTPYEWCIWRWKNG